MAGIASIIAGVVEGLGNTITGGINIANKLYSERIIAVNNSRNQSSLTRNLPILILAVLVLIVFIIIYARK